ncbi:hypothetical protein D3C78_1506260 [compost metagenome]
MDHQRLAAGPCRADMHAKALALPLEVGDAASALAVFHAVVVETGFADRHHARQRGALEQVLHAGLGHVFRVRVHAHRGPEIVVLRGQGVHIGKLFHGGADAQGAVHLRFGHGGADFGQAGRQGRVVQMAVGIGKHGKTLKNKNADLQRVGMQPRMPAL